ncbi:MAG: urea amidolyase associated protein UAAP2 [Arenicellales bacterium]
MSDIVASSLDPETAVHDHIVPARLSWSGTVRKGQAIRIVDSEGRQAVDALFYNAHRFEERYSAQGTLAAQGSAYISTGSRLLSNEGRVLAVVTADTVGGHDTSAGACSCESNTVRFGHHTRHMHACRQNFLLELARYGMGRRDIVSNINFFMNVPILPNGELAIVDGTSKPGDYIELRAEMDVLCVLSNCPQVNNPCNDFNPTPIRVLIWHSVQSVLR